MKCDNVRYITFCGFRKKKKEKTPRKVLLLGVQVGNEQKGWRNRETEIKITNKQTGHRTTDVFSVIVVGSP